MPIYYFKANTLKSFLGYVAYLYGSMTEDNSSEDSDSQKSFQELLDFICQNEMSSHDPKFHGLESPSEGSSVSEGMLTKIIESGADNHGDNVSSFDDTLVSTPQSAKYEGEYVGPLSNDSGYPMSCEAKCSESLPPLYEISPQPFKPVIANETVPKGNFSGEYLFEVSLGEPTEYVSKNANYTHSPELNKLYTKMNVACPIHFKCAIEPPYGVIIRAKMVFKMDAHSSEPVLRCPVHCGDHSMKTPEAKHVIQLYNQEIHSGVSYVTRNNQQSVTVEYKKPNFESEWCTVCYKFACRSSCVGGISRRPVAAVFTLEDNAGTILGSFSIEVKICSSPGRDRKHDENRKHKSPCTAHYSFPSKKARLIVAENSPPVETGFRYLKVKNEFYDVMNRINTAFELSALVPEEQVQEYHDRESGRNSMLNVLGEFLNKMQK